MTRLSSCDLKKYHELHPLTASRVPGEDQPADRQDALSDVGRHCSLQSAVDFFTPQCHGEFLDDFGCWAKDVNSHMRHKYGISFVRFHLLIYQGVYMYICV